MRPHRQQPTRLPRPWDSPGKNTGVGCHFLLQCMKVKSKSEAAQSCPTLSDPMDCRPTRLFRPWDFPGKSTGVGCHCLYWRLGLFFPKLKIVVFWKTMVTHIIYAHCKNWESREDTKKNKNLLILIPRGKHCNVNIFMKSILRSKSQIWTLPSAIAGHYKESHFWSSITSPTVL